MPNRALQAEFEALRDPDTRLIQAEQLHDWAMSHRSSELYQQLDAGGWWDDAKAGREYRLHLIRRLIIVHMVDGESRRTQVSLRVDRVREGGGYRDMSDVQQMPDMVDQVLDDAMRDAMHFVTKYETLRDLVGESGDRLFDALDAFIAEHQQRRVALRRAPRRASRRPDQSVTTR